MPSFRTGVVVRLLEERRGQWVAYHGERRLGIGPTPTGLYDECLRQGLPAESLVIAQVLEISGTEYVGGLVLECDD